ncbi:hypothetical protein [Streptococcus moroccensis]|uniref:Nucleotidyltransferase n=1 Tax=Streptococcus moroccensis TaxID=1451356 RepID=A0ABT9YSY6_9STRE|nr:hypothetical protein [Streptococcus moroccensis]MDQ0222742.1 hypothetical protein [Streptococcus moroccensis]
MTEDLQALLDALNYAYRKLEALTRPGCFEFFLGGFVSSMVKQSHIEEADISLKIVGIHFRAVQQKYPEIAESLSDDLVFMDDETLFSGKIDREQVVIVQKSLEHTIHKVKELVVSQPF